MLAISILFNYEISIGERIFYISPSILFCCLGTCLGKIAMQNRKLLTSISKGDIYIAKCYSFEKRVFIKTSHNSSRDCFEIKVCDKDGHYMNQWFEIDKKTYKSFDKVEAYLFLIKYLDTTIIKVKTNYQLYRHF